jgi:hypothetical protein
LGVREDDGKEDENKVAHRVMGDGVFSGTPESDLNMRGFKPFME